MEVWSVQGDEASLVDADRLARLVSLQNSLEAALGLQEQLEDEGLQVTAREVIPLLERQLEQLNDAIADVLGSKHLRVLGLKEVPSRRTLIDRRNSMLEQYSPSRFADLPAHYQELAASDRLEVEAAFAELMTALYGPEAPGSEEFSAMDEDADLESEEESGLPAPSRGELSDSIIFLLEGKNRPLTVTELAGELKLPHEQVLEVVLQEDSSLTIPFWPYAESVGLPRWGNLLQQVASHAWEQLRTRLLPERMAILDREKWLAILNEAKLRRDPPMIERAQRFFEV